MAPISGSMGEGSNVWMHVKNTLNMMKGELMLA
eukprot:CAMPEP_0183459268 /NCGR_PEP_ID=MMETSP0370-20130417/135239_1 /TAXON_ID=268820 /ORGANISM="Peridinium aciculiferum, Strain PAER-2" /LENGTH=32 /DNA_ID= /DNA_START= /DNA_END= /DNA_ORIENTATION=